MVTNSTIETLLNRRSIRKFVAEPFDDDTVATLETVAQHAASSQYLNDWSAVRVKDPALKKRMSEIGRQPYIAEAPLLYVFVADEHRNAIIAESKGVPTDSDTYGLAGSYRFSQAQNDAVLALHAMETAAYSLGLGCVILGSLLNDVPGLIEALHLPQYTYPVLGLAILCWDWRSASPIRPPRSSLACLASCSSSMTCIRRMMTPLNPSRSVSAPLTFQCMSTTICATPIVPLTHSAIRSPRLQPSAWTPRIR